MHLNPDPNVLAFGHSPAGMPLTILCIVDGLNNKSKPGIVWTKSQVDISKFVYLIFTYFNKIY